MSPAAKSGCTLRILQKADTSHSIAQQIIPHLSGTFQFITALLTDAFISENTKFTYCLLYFPIKQHKNFINHLSNIGGEIL